MSIFDIIAVLVTLAAVFGYVNHRWFKLEPAVGLLMIPIGTGVIAPLWGRLSGKSAH